MRSVLGIVLLLLTALPSAADQERGFNPRKVVRTFPVLKDPPVVAAAKVKNQVRDPELVLGVTIGKEARAYPINQLTGPAREIINDRLGGRAIAATW